MVYIIICIIGIIGFIACEIIEDIMWECDREKAFGYELKRYCGVKKEDKK